MACRNCSAAFAAFCVVFAATSAHAEIGKASAGPGEWFMGFNVGAGVVWGTAHEAYVGYTGEGLSPTAETTYPVNFDEGLFFSGGGEIGYRLAEPAAGIDRIEFDLDLGMMSRDVDRDANHALLGINDGDNRIFGGLSKHFDPDLRIGNEEETAWLEARLSFKSVLFEDDGHAVLAGIEPFFRYQDTDSHVEVSRDIASSPVFISRGDTIEAEYYGLQLALEMEKPLTEALSLVGRASAGAYHVTSDIGSRVESQNDPVSVSDSGSEWGGRFGGALGVKVPLYYAGASLTVLGTLDYMTDVATIDHIPFPSSGQFGLTKAAFDDQLELGGKIGLIFPLR